MPRLMLLEHVWAKASSRGTRPGKAVPEITQTTQTTGSGRYQAYPETSIEPSTAGFSGR